MDRTGLQAPFWLDHDDTSWFPDVELAMPEPNGLLAVGGDLSTPRLLAAYRSGIFPWYSQGQPIMWWSPSPRAVLYPTEITVSRSLRKTIRNKRYDIKVDCAFKPVIQYCASSRRDGLGTWITREMMNAYIQLHNLGFAHSIEIWQDDQLVGGLYGIAIGRIFFGESMFSRMRDASKIALVALARHLDRFHFPFIDCQVESDHLKTLGARNIPRKTFVRQLNRYCTDKGKIDHAAIWNNFISRDELITNL